MRVPRRLNCTLGGLRSAVGERTADTAIAASAAPFVMTSRTFHDPQEESAGSGVAGGHRGALGLYTGAAR
jgi:hypothetical protein